MPEEEHDEIELVRCADCYGLHRNTAFCIPTGKRIDFPNTDKECEFHYPAIYTFSYIYALDQNLHKNEFTKFEKVIIFFVISAFMIILYHLLIIFLL